MLLVDIAICSADNGTVLSSTSIWLLIIKIIIVYMNMNSPLGIKMSVGLSGRNPSLSVIWGVAVRRFLLLLAFLLPLPGFVWD